MTLERTSSLSLRSSRSDSSLASATAPEPATREQPVPLERTGPPGLPARRDISVSHPAQSGSARQSRTSLPPRRDSTSLPQVSPAGSLDRAGTASPQAQARQALAQTPQHEPQETSLDIALEELDTGRTQPASAHLASGSPDVAAAPAGVERDASIEVDRMPGVPSHRDLNPILSFSHLKAQLPQDVEGCVAHMLSSMGEHVGDTAALAARQAATLRAHGIDDRDKFVALLSNVSWRDYGTSMLHGMASGSGFAAGGAAVDYAAAQGLSQLVADKLSHLPPSVVGLVAGSALGFALSVMDVGAGASARKTFAGAYFTRPSEDILPDAWRGRLPQHTRASLANDMQASAGLSYGAARNGLLRVPISVALEATGHSALRSAVDNVIDVVGGDTIGAGGMRVGLNVRDEGAGRAGLQHFLARTDLDQCLGFLEQPAHAQVGNALGRLGRHVVNLGTTLPQATLDAFASKVGWVSHAVLTPGFGGVFAIIEGMPGALAASGLSKNAANVCTQLTKFAALQCLYQGWGGALGATAGGAGPRPRDVEDA